MIVLSFKRNSYVCSRNAIVLICFCDAGKGKPLPWRVKTARLLGSVLKFTVYFKFTSLLL